MAVVAKTEAQILPSTLKDVMANTNQCPVTKEYLRRSSQIADRIREDQNSWKKWFISFSSDERFFIAVGGVLSGFFAIVTYIPFPGPGAPSLFATLLRGGIIAIPSTISSASDSSKSNYASTNAEELEKKLPSIKNELEKSGLADGDIERITSIFDREIRLLRNIERNEKQNHGSKLGLGISSSLWTLGTAIGVPVIPALGICGGVLSVLAAAERYGANLGLKPQEEAANLKTEIQQLKIS